MQRSQVLGNKIEMEITQLVEANPSLLRLGLHLEYNDARHRVASHLQRNIDRSKYPVFKDYIGPTAPLTPCLQDFFQKDRHFQLILTCI